MYKYLTPTEVAKLEQIMAEADVCLHCTQPECLGNCPEHMDPRPALHFLAANRPPDLDEPGQAETAVTFADAGIEESFA